MRRMFSEKQIINLARETIEDAEYVSLDGDLNVDGDLAVGVNVAVDGDITCLGDITCKELLEKNDTELIDLTTYVNSNFAKSHTFYAKMYVKHNILHVVVSGGFVAGASAGTNPTILTNFMSLVPDNLKAKLFRMDGTPISEAKDTLSYIAFTSVVKRVGTSFSNSQCAIDSSSQTSLTIAGFSFGTIAEDTECQIDIRFELLL